MHTEHDLFPYSGDQDVSVYDSSFPIPRRVRPSKAKVKCFTDNNILGFSKFSVFVRSVLIYLFWKIV